MSKPLPGDSLWKNRPIIFDTREAQRSRALEVLRAGFTQGSSPRSALVGAAQLHGTWVVDEMLSDGLIIEKHDGSLEATPPPPKRVRLPGDTMFDIYSAYPPPVDGLDYRRYRVLAVLRAGFTQGERPALALSAAAKTSESIVQAMIGEGLILVNPDGTLEAAPNADHHARPSAEPEANADPGDPFAPSSPYE